MFLSSRHRPVLEKSYDIDHIMKVKGIRFFKTYLSMTLLESHNVGFDKLYIIWIYII